MAAGGGGDGDAGAGEEPAKPGEPLICLGWVGLWRLARRHRLLTALGLLQLEKKTAEQEEARVQAGTLADELDAMRRTRQAEAEVLMESLESALKRSRELEERLGQVEAALLGAETDRKEAGGRAALEVRVLAGAASRNTLSK